jgi:hypothetical protein
MTRIEKYKFRLQHKPGNTGARWWMLVLFIIISASKLYAQEELDYSVHANIIYRFTKYINWPRPKETGNFVIGIVGSTPLYEELKKAVNGKKVGEQNIVLQKFSSSAAAFNCQILFISETATGSLKKIAGNTQGNPVLLVSESKGAAQKGSCINFSIINDKLKLEFNKNNIEQRGLSIASELLQLGTQVK